MKKSTIFLLCALTAVSAFADDYATNGSGKSYTLESLSAISGSGVTKNGKVYTMANSVTIAAGDKFTIESGATIKMGDAVELRISGEANMAVDENSRVLVTRNADTDEPKGIVLAGDSEQPASFNNYDFEYAGLRNLSAAGFNVTGCTFRYNNGKQTSVGALGLGVDGACFTVTDCTFEYNTVPAIGGAANAANGVAIYNSVFTDNNTANTNKPQINLTVGNDNYIVIENCTITGAQRTMVGGIAIANIIGFEGDNTVYMEGNEIRDNRYGVAFYGGLNATMIENKIIDNKYDASAMTGGAGISIYDYAGKPNVMAGHNTISGNLWGVCVIGGENINFGNVSVDKTSDDYNEGHNVFSDNGNGGALYDLYNNSALTVYAQGNKWGVDEQTAEKIETVVYHKADNASLGEVIYTPAWDGEGAVARIDSDVKARYANGKVIADGASIEVYSASGKLVEKTTGVADLAAFAKGVYVVKVSTTDGATTLKCIR